MNESVYKTYFVYYQIIMFKTLFKKKNKETSSDSSHSTDLKVKTSIKIQSLKNKISKLLKNKLGKSAIQGEEIIGLELTTNEIKIAKVTNSKDNKWTLSDYYIHKFDGLSDEDNVIDHQDKISNELILALQKTKIVTTNVAFAIPVTSAIIRVVTAPLMSDEEFQKAIETNTLWENLVQLTENLSDYSIFHQIINRDQTANTMEILFVASKLSDVNAYTQIIQKAGLNPVIIDVKCFALKSAVDQINKISGSIEENNLTAVLEFGLDENYVMILYDNNPIITDIFIRNQDRQILKSVENNYEEKEAFAQRYLTQVRQAIQDFETKYEKRIRNVRVTSNLPNVENYLASFRKSLTTTGFQLFDPLNGIKIPAQYADSLNLKNKSYLSYVIGLAFRQLDVFGYYKFVTAVKNINLLPNREKMMAEKKAKVFSQFAFKGIVGAVAAIYIILLGFSFWQIHSLNKKIINYEAVLLEHKAKTLEKKKFSNELGLINRSLELSNSLKSNKVSNFRILAQIASSVPKRVRFNNIDYNGKNLIVIEGEAFGDQDIIKFIDNLNNQKMISRASLASMSLPQGQAGTQQLKGFKIACILENV